MHSLVDTFLNFDQFHAILQRVTSFNDELVKLPKDKKIKRIKQLFEFQKFFSTDSQQGLAGIFNIDTGIAQGVNGEYDSMIVSEQYTLMYPLVFKLSIEINRTIEHEFFVLKKLNNLRKFCPNFVGTFGMLNGYVTREFFETPEKVVKTNILEQKPQQAVPTSYLLLEYVSDITFEHVYEHGDIQSVTSILLGVLCALQIAQTKLQFTHYDLHDENILIRNVEPDSFFAYIIDGKCVAYPTCGWFPVLIDMGSSYIKGIEERPTRTSICNYHRGMQSTLYDPLGDLHHFMLNAMSGLELQDHQPDVFLKHFKWVATRVMHMFRYSSVWRNKGWKQLPCNLYHLFNEYVKKLKLNLGPVYSDLRLMIIETVTLGVKLPWKPLSDAELDEMLQCYFPGVQTETSSLEFLLSQGLLDLVHFLNMIDSDPNTKSDVNILYVLRALVEHAALIPETKPGEIFVVPKETVNNFKQLTHSMYTWFSYKLDLNRSFRGASILTKLLRHLFYKFNESNLNLMKDWYSKTDVKTPLEIAEFLQQNTPLRYEFNPDAICYVWDADKEQQHRVSMRELGLNPDRAGYKSMQEAILNRFG
jgi:hypothetical protein